MRNPKAKLCYWSLLFALICHSEILRSAANNILVVGSINADTFLPVSRLPSEGENIMLLPGKQPIVDVPGGKGCTQAVSASKLYRGENARVCFLGQFGNDSAAKMLRKTLVDRGIKISSLCAERHKDLPSGRGYVFITNSGSVSAIVSGGSNESGWKAWRRAWEQRQQLYSMTNEKNIVTGDDIDELLDGVECVMLQREIPEYVNLLVATEAKKRGILVLQDIGGEERKMDRAMMEACDYLIPNETELKRLVSSFEKSAIEQIGEQDNSIDQPNEAIVRMAKVLQKHGARNVLVTQGSRGSTLITESGHVLHQPSYALQPSEIVDETGAGDCYRAAFAVALLEGRPLQRCMEYASAAGCCAVQEQGAVPSTPSREKVEEWYEKMRKIDSVLNIARGNGQGEKSQNKRQPRDNGLSSRGGGAEKRSDFPFLIGSRLNSMKDRPELWNKGCLKDARDFVKRQAHIRGLTCVDFNYPQHFGKGVWKDNADIKTALEEASLVAGAVCLRYPPKFARGAMNHPDPELRREAIELTKAAARTALELGSNEVCVWSAFDGYDYPFQVDYDEKWNELVNAFQECCDAYPNVKFSLEYKPTDENTRFFTVASTGAALQLVDEIGRPNMGLTLDVGHVLMSGENPGQSIAMVGRKGKLMGIQLNDGYTRLAAEDGMMFGSIHPSMALEIMYQLRRIKFRGHFYFDTFPQRTDPIKEAEHNIERVKAFWYAAAAMDEKKLKEVRDQHDAIGALELIESALGEVYGRQIGTL